jgi:hypothetical protein
MLMINQMQTISIAMILIVFIFMNYFIYTKVVPTIAGTVIQIREYVTSFTDLNHPWGIRNRTPQGFYKNKTGTPFVYMMIRKPDLISRHSETGWINELSYCSSAFPQPG